MRYKPEYADPLYHEQQERMLKQKADSFIDSHPILRDNHKQIGGILIAICAAIIILTLFSCIRTYVRQSAISSYTPVKAEVTDVQEIAKRHARSTNYDYRLIGTYEVNGVTYNASKVVDTYSQSKTNTFTVYYNPSDPSDFVAELSAEGYGNLMARTIIITLLFGVAIYFLFRYMKYGHIKTKPDYMDYIHEYTQGGNPTAAKMYEQQNSNEVFGFYQSPEEPSDGNTDPWKS